jgi:hypothetical protein
MKKLLSFFRSPGPLWAAEIIGLLQVKSLQKSKDFFQLIEEPYGRSPTVKALSVGFFYRLEIFFLVAACPRWDDNRMK